MKKRNRTRKRKAGSMVPSTGLAGRLPTNSPRSKTASYSGQAQSTTIEPPQFAEKLLHFVLPKEESDTQIGDLAEHYKRVHPKLGAKCSRAWYYKEVWILVWRRFPTIIKRIPYGWIGEFLRRYVS